MNKKILLSICLPIYNRKNHFLKLLNSIDLRNQIEIVISDDGSTENIKNIAEKFKKKFKINYFKKKNRGRSSALTDAIKKACGDFIIIMDSDDFFEPGGLKKIIDQILISPKEKFFCFGTNIIYGKKKIKNNLIPDGYKINLLKFRADNNFRGDLKEVTKTNLVKKCIYKKSYEYRFVPTSLIWERVSRYSDCMFNSSIIANKTYQLRDGITANISRIKFENAGCYYDLFKRLAVSNLYTSKFFRFKSIVQFYRYLFKARKKLKFKFSYAIHIIIGYIFYNFDKYRFLNKKKITN